ncbi:MAG: helicase HerA-like domain-containing protein [Actinomycetota bacterium]
MHRKDPHRHRLREAGGKRPRGVGHECDLRRPHGDRLRILGSGHVITGGNRPAQGEKGAPCPVAATRLRAPRSDMGTATEARVDALVAASTLLPRYRDAVDGESAYEMLTTRMEQQRAAAERQTLEEERAAELEELEERIAKERAEGDMRLERERATAQKEEVRRRAARQKQLDSLLSSALRTAGREITRSIFGTRGR